MASADAALLRKVLARLQTVQPAPSSAYACEGLVGAALFACSVPRNRLRNALIVCSSDCLDKAGPILMQLIPPLSIRLCRSCA
jgi:hypothetical protein